MVGSDALVCDGQADTEARWLRNPSPKKSGNTTSQNKTDAQAVQADPSPSSHKGKETKEPKVK
ncbi:hypothetical protein E2C01_023661 [Portunus trituberculatus]|uniref:Uncharacterized protein n=1 Tax=Portunus trituberculatus TaxID=210409 RepID=A0A5B7E9P4_PORTR|nr:hypothetical protein [Portunus trituberculatus]